MNHKNEKIKTFLDPNLFDEYNSCIIPHSKEKEFHVRVRMDDAEQFVFLIIWNPKI